MNRHLKLTLAIVILGLVAVAAPASAQTLESLRSVGMGDAFAGGGTGNGALFHNPAGISIASLYSFEAGYRHDQLSGTNSFGASVVDSKTNPVLGGGFAYNYGFNGGDAADDDSDNFRGHDLRGALSMPVVPGRVAVGLGGHYVIHRTYRTAMDEGGVEANDRVDYRGFTLDTGVMASLSQNFVLGFSAMNLLEIEGVNLDRTLNTGLGVYLGPLHLEGQYSRTVTGDHDNPNTYAGGVEYVAAQVPLRLGFRSDGPMDARLFTAGVGYRSETAGLDVAFQQDVEYGQNRSFGLTFSMYL